jgi:heme/copper-type cytochrome/quinol oxidase subunit 3
MGTALEEMHHIPQHIRVGRARAGVIMLMISDALSVLAILAAGGYLSALNVGGQFRVGDNAPPFLPSVLLAVVLALSGLFYYLWARTVGKEGQKDQRIFFVLALVLMIISLAAQIWIGAPLGYARPFHAYASIILFVVWFSVVHYLLAVIVGVLFYGRMQRGRLAGYEFHAEVVGYWWYYTVIAGLVLWVFTLLIS